ncbi:MAG: uroporphyrinogen-III C-methyltransferase [Deltaproteobacteria bacterium]|nr:uroporphyrinogen-III C-methyltransferase [Deltaproteobacteria bacterium]
MLLPVNLSVKGRLCVIVGGGPVANRKCRKLLEHGARVRVVSPDFHGGDGAWTFTDIDRRECPYGKDLLGGAFLAIAATDDPGVNRRVLADAAEMGILAQRTDDPGEGDFSFPATLRRGNFTVSFATDGISPALSAHLRAEAAGRYGAAYGEFLRLIGSLKEKGAWKEIPRERRRRLSMELLDRDVLEALSRGEADQARREFLTRVHRPEAPTDADGPALSKTSGGSRKTVPGKVYLVGAGPGDPGLLTIRGMECLLAADTVLSDGIANPALLEMYCPHAERIHAGKRKGNCAKTQEEINDLLVGKALEGKTVVRLKGGDPMIFGRGGEEARALFRAGIPFEVVPGVSCVSAVPAYAGIPLTDREHASSFAVYSAHKRGGLGFSDKEWERIAGDSGTLVFLMGVTRCRTVVEKLLAFGRSPETPIALISGGTTPGQRRVVGTLESFLSGKELPETSAPGLIVVGDVVRAIPEMDWFRPAEEEP